MFPEFAERNCLPDGRWQPIPNGTDIANINQLLEGFTNFEPCYTYLMKILTHGSEADSEVIHLILQTIL